MTHANGKTTCDAEIGHYKRGWHICNRKALVIGLGLWHRLDACAKHAPKMAKETPVVPRAHL